MSSLGKWLVSVLCHSLASSCGLRFFDFSRLPSNSENSNRKMKMHDGKPKVKEDSPLLAQVCWTRRGRCAFRYTLSHAILVMS